MNLPQTICRLCVNPCNDLKGFYDQNGRGNELYNITSTYFHPKIVNMDEAKYLTGICAQCWRHICDFHSFQTSVLVAQLKLLQGAVITGIISDENKDGISFPSSDNIKTATTIVSNNGAVAKNHKPEAQITNKATNLAPQEAEIINLDSDEEVPLSTNPSHTQSLHVSSAVSSIFNGDRKIEHVDELVAKWLPGLKCVVCSMSFSTVSSLKLHFRRQHRNDKFTILCCSRKFTREKFKEHALLHKDPAALKCGLCDRKYSTKDSLKLHVIRKHPEYANYVCRICGAKNKTYEDQRLHYSTQHKTDPPPRAVVQPNGRTKYQCSECDTISHTIFAFYRHYWSLHGTGERNGRESAKGKENSQTTIDSGASPTSAPTEGHVNKNKRNRESLNELQPMAERGPHQCPKCDKDFHSPRDMIEHLAALHLNMMLYTCPCCPETFQMVTHIVQHRKSKHPLETKIKYYENIDDKYNKLVGEYVKC